MQDLGFKAFGVRVAGFGFWIQGLWFWIGFNIDGLGVGAYSLGLQFKGSGFRV